MFRIRSRTDPRGAEKRELMLAFRALQENDRCFQQARGAFYIDQLIFERAAIMSHCRCLLATIRKPNEKPGKKI